MKQLIGLLLITALASCGGVHKARRDVGPLPPQPVTAPIPITPTVVGVTTPGVTPAAAPAPAPAAAAAPAVPLPKPKPFASGPLSKACMSSDRKARSRELCGCIQAVADQTLSGTQQRTAVSFYDDPHKAQVIRQSDKPAHEKFWEDYKSYGERAAQICG